MVEALALLHQEHANLGRLLNLLEAQIGLFAAGDAPDFDLVRDIVDYVAAYPDRFHHPKEDLVFEKLVARAGQTMAAVDELVAEHVVLARMTADLELALNQVALDAEVPRAHLAGLAREFVDLLRRHMAREEEEVLPLAAEFLTADDWREIDAALTAGEDPLFGSVAHSRYETLRDSLIRFGA